MEELINKLCDIPGVFGAAILHYGQCLAHRLSPPHEPILLGEVIDLLGRMSDTLESIEGPQQLDNFFIRFQDGQLFVAVAGELSVVILASHDAKAAALSVGVNVAQLKLKRLATSNQAAFAASPVHAAPGAPLPPSAPPPPRQPAPPARSGFPAPQQNMAVAAAQAPRAPFGGFSGQSSSVGGGFLSPEPSQGASGQRAAPPPLPPQFSQSNPSGGSLGFSFSQSQSQTDNVPMGTIRKLIRIVSNYTEDDGKVILRRTLAHMGATPTTLPKHQLNALLSALAGLMPPRQRDEFNRETAIFREVSR